MEIDLTPDGQGGYDALVRGGVPPDNATTALCTGITQMIFDKPDDYHVLAGLIDSTRSGQLTCDKILTVPLFYSLLAPDVTIDGQMWLSIGFGAHLIPCDSGECTRSTPADQCHDRAQDGAETGVDCGGTCGPCSVPQPTCTDGVRDGLETDVDCGWNCAKCATGKHCWTDADCASGTCNGQCT
jgi:hypothetical protein